MFTLPSFNSDGMSVEFGGEFVDSNHETIQGLCKEFGIPLDSYIDENRGLEQNIYFFKNQYYTDADAIRAMAPIAAKLKSDIARLDLPGVTEAFDKLSLDAYLHTLGGKTESWFLDLLRVGMLAEGGFGSERHSALYLLGTLSPDTSKGFKIYGDSDQAHCIRGGTVSLISALKAALNSRGVEIHTAHQLVKIRETTSSLQLSFKNNGTTQDVTAEQAICTIPFTTLREVEGLAKLTLRPQKLDCIQHLTYSPAGKMITGYRSRSWRKKSTNSAAKPPPSNGMVYTDLRSQNTWEASRTQKGSSGILTNFLGAEEGRSIGDKTAAAMIAANKRIFPSTSSDLDGHSVFWNWAKFPLSLGAYSSVLVGDYSRYGKVAALPELKGRLHFAGEHATDKFSGFMEGGAYSGVQAARAVMNKNKK